MMSYEILYGPFETILVTNNYFHKETMDYTFQDSFVASNENDYQEISASIKYFSFIYYLFNIDII